MLRFPIATGIFFFFNHYKSIGSISNLNVLKLYNKANEATVLVKNVIIVPTVMADEVVAAAFCVQPATMSPVH